MNIPVLPTTRSHRWKMSDYNPQDPEHTRQVTVTCKRCGCNYQLDAFFAEVFGPGVCDTCGRILNAEETAAREASQTTPAKRFASLAPRLFFEGETSTNPGRKGFPAAAYDRTMMWNHTGLGLVLYGPSGTGKSRILWALLRRLIVDDRIDTEILQGGDFRQRMIEAYRAERSEIIIDRLSRVPVLAWDDFGQDALKEGMETDLRSIIDYRYRESLPLVITTQFSPDALAQRISGGNVAREDVCASIVRRITARCEVIAL